MRQNGSIPAWRFFISSKKGTCLPVYHHQESRCNIKTRRLKNLTLVLPFAVNLEPATPPVSQL